MFKARDYVILTFIVMLFSLAMMNLGINLLTNENAKLSDESKDYIITYTSLATEKFNTSEFESSIANLEETQTNLTQTQENYDFSREYIDSLKKQSKIKFIFTMVTNMPTFVVLSLGLNLDDYALYINIIGWFLTVAILIVGILFIKGVI